jgi:hypothetical protein
MLACYQVAAGASAPHSLCDRPISHRPAPEEQPRLALPAGSLPCPASGPSASCSTQDAGARATAGVSSLPAGTSACPLQAGKRKLNAPASCNSTLLATPQTAGTTGHVGAAGMAPRVTPSVPVWTMSSSGSQPSVQLTSSATVLKSAQSATLTATASATVTGTRSAIEIFDQTTGTLVGACMQGSQCLVAYSATAGAHTFAAYVTAPTANQPTQTATSNRVNVAWGVNVSLATSSAAVVGPGKAVTFTATATADVAGTGYQLGLYDQTSGTRLTYCSRGTTCSTALTKSLAGAHSIVAFVASASDIQPSPEIQAQSAPVTATWLGVSLEANTTSTRPGSPVFMLAKANVDVTNTPWSIGIYDQSGVLVSEPCKSGTTCSAQLTPATDSTPWFTAVIGAARPLIEGSSTLVKLVRTVQMHASLVNIQARSKPVQPTRLLWGVDSCKPITGDGSANAGLYAQVTRHYGAPDFWGRYMTRTDNCPGLSSIEIGAAAYRHLGILPIYNAYDCNAVRGYDTGLRYGTEATTAAANLGIPQGTAVAVDIEPYGEQCPGAAHVDAAFIEGWYDGVLLASYVPLYYGNGTSGSEFGNAWCRAVSERPEVAIDSFLWTFQPSLLGRFTRASAPAFSPNRPGCSGNFAAWQYVLSSGATPDVDSDEALSTLPLWFPQPQ